MFKSGWMSATYCILGASISAVVTNTVKQNLKSHLNKNAGVAPCHFQPSHVGKGIYPTRDYRLKNREST